MKRHRHPFLRTLLLVLIGSVITGESTMSLELDDRRQAAFGKIEDLEALAVEVQKKDIDTAYYEIAAHTGRFALEERWDLREQEDQRQAYLDWIERETASAQLQLKAILDGQPALEAPPLPKAEELELKDGYLRKDGQPILLLGFMGGSDPSLRDRYFFQDRVMAIVSGVGGTRFDYTTSPVWPLYQKDPSTHRVWAGGWCGHIICDNSSIGGVSGGPCIICLESTAMREAISQYIERETLEKRDDPQRRFYSLYWELAYICFCDTTKEMWQNWLMEKHSDIATLNGVWGTEFGDFASVTLPPMKIMEEENPAKWYDFARFNCWRFTEYMKWAQSEIRKHDPDALTCTGAPFYMLAAKMGWAGIDTELLNDVMDVVLNESHPSTLTTDVLMGLNRKGSLLQDPEYHGDIAHLMAHFLHGDGFMQMWWWPRRPTYKPISFYYDDVMRSPRVPLDDLALLMRNALDLRRLSKEIVQFHQRTAPLAILYSHDSMLQIPAFLRESRRTPYLQAVHTAYDGLLYLDAFTRFTSERQIDDGGLDDIRVLVLPGVEYQNAETADHILDWVEDGGTLVMTPNTWLADEYARPADYLSRIGINLDSMVMPGIEVSEARPDIERPGGFIMGAISEIELKNVPKASLEVASVGPFAGKGVKLEGWGVRQNISCTADDAETLARFGDGSPALVRIPRGKGEVYYLAIPLTEQSFGDFMDPVFDAAGFPRPVRISSADGSNRPPNIESRTIPDKDGYLTYVINLNPEPVNLRLYVPSSVTRIENLSYERDSSTDLALGRFETVLLRLHQE